MRTGMGRLLGGCWVVAASIRCIYLLHQGKSCWGGSDAPGPAVSCCRCTNCGEGEGYSCCCCCCFGRCCGDAAGNADSGSGGAEGYCWRGGDTSREGAVPYCCRSGAACPCCCAGLADSARAAAAACTYASASAERLCALMSTDEPPLDCVLIAGSSAPAAAKAAVVASAHSARRCDGENGGEGMCGGQAVVEVCH